MENENINIIKEYPHWDIILPEAEGLAVQIISELSPSPDIEIACVLTDDAHIKKLNHQFRGKDKPTNVLSFPADEESMLGDIIISLDTLEREAIEQNKDLKSHFIHMLIHGMLHLLGYDHEEDADAQIMEAKEISILANMGIKNPYEEMAL